jgi:Ion channel
MNTSPRQARSVDTEGRKRFGLLLLAIAAEFVLQGVASPGRWEQVIVSVLLAATVLLALQVADVTPLVIRPVALLALLLVLLSLVEALVGAANGIVARIADLLLVILAPPAIVLGIVRTLRARNQVTLEAVFGVLCLYLLLGMFFAFLYGAIGQIDGRFFAQDVKITAARCLYFSFATLTTVGYGDLTAASNLGHTLSVSEALLGQIYLVTIVSVIVGNLGMRRRHGAEGQRPGGSRGR